ncbi:MAG: UDP-3-O-(3-hydroxymyristoyl)glucosamine N-acyltransferase [Pseudomonadota bacterium]
MKLQQIIEALGIDETAVDDNVSISSINTLSSANNHELSFLDNKKYIKELAQTQAAAVLIHADYKDNVPKNCIALICEEPYVTLAKASKLFAPNLLETEGKKAKLGRDVIIQDNVSLGLDVIIGNNCTLMAGVVIADNVKIGNNSIIYPNVVVYRDCLIGDDCIIHAGTVIGSDGFGFAISQTGEYTKIYQNGNVVIGNNVEIGANCTIDRAVFSSTIIEQQCRIDNLIHIAHNCHLGKGCILAAQVGLSGSTTLGEHVVMAGKAATTGHLSIAPFTTLSGRAVATKSVKKAGQYAGYPLMEHRQWLKLKAKLQRFLKSS